MFEYYTQKKLFRKMQDKMLCQTRKIMYKTDTIQKKDTMQNRYYTFVNTIHAIGQISVLKEGQLHTKRSKKGKGQLHKLRY